MNSQRRFPLIGARTLNSRVGAQHWLPNRAQHPDGRVGPRSSPYSWDPNDGSISPSPEPVRNPRLTIRYWYKNTPQRTVEVTFGLSPSYGIWTVEEAHGWFRRMMRDHEEFVVETDEAGALPLSFSSETVRRVVVE